MNFHEVTKEADTSVFARRLPAAVLHLGGLVTEQSKAFLF